MAFETHAIVELMGHARIAGKVTEETVFGTAMCRVDIPKTPNRDAFTKFYSAGAIYCITPTDEATAQAAANRFNEAPVQPWILPSSPLLAQKVVASSRYDEADDYPGYDDDDDSPYVDDDDYYDQDDDDFDEDGGDVVQHDVTPRFREAAEALLQGTGYAHEHKIAAAKQAAAFVREPFVIFDTETTGFDDHDQIIQIAVIDQDGAVLLNTYIKPEGGIHNSQYHGITDETVKEAPAFPSVYPQIIAAMANKRVVAYNLAYDRKMLNQDVKRHQQIGLAWTGVTGTLCAMELYAEFHGEWNDYHENYRWQKLDVAAAALGVKREGEAHDALSDAQVTLGVLRAMAAWHDKNTAKEAPVSA